MKLTNKKYAQALFESVNDKSEKEINVILKNFTTLLIKNNALAKIDKIIEEFDDIWNKENKIVKATITTAQEIDKSTSISLENYIKELSGAEKLEVENKINKDLISGTIIKYGDRILDNSLKTKINNLRIKMNSN
jgi:F-type H+-transporting ATPase subunit delta